MRYGDLPFAPVRPSRLVFGTIPLKEKELEAGFDLLDAAFEAGYNAFDTAALYGGGTCERVLGRWMEARGNRDRVFVIGKGAHHNADRRRVTPVDITADLFDSLARQRHGHIDLHLLHRDDPDCDVGPIVEILNEHHAAGRIRAFGGSNWTAPRIAEANEYAEKHGLVPFAASSPNLSLAVQAQPPWADCLSLSGPDGAADRGWYRREGMPLFTWSSLAGGFFSGRLKRQNREKMGAELGRWFTDCYFTEENFERLDRARELAADKGVSVPQIALAWVLHQNLDIYALVAPRNARECRENAAVFDIELTAAELEWLDLQRDQRE